MISVFFPDICKLKGILVFESFFHILKREIFLKIIQLKSNYEN